MAACVTHRWSLTVWRGAEPAPAPRELARQARDRDSSRRTCCEPEPSIADAQTPECGAAPSEPLAPAETSHDGARCATQRPCARVCARADAPTAANLARDAQLVRWHRRLGHVGAQTLAAMPDHCNNESIFSLGPISEHYIRDKLIGNGCDVCPQARLMRAPSSSEPRRRRSARRHRVRQR